MDKEFKMEAESRGECMGSLLDLMAVNLFDAIRNVYEAEDDIKEGRWDEVKRKCLESIPKCAKMYIYLDGIELDNEELILNEFVSRIVPRGWLCNDWSDIKERYQKWKSSEGSEAVAIEVFNYTRELVRDCDKTFLRLQPSLRIHACLESREEGSVLGE